MPDEKRMVDCRRCGKSLKEHDEIYPPKDDLLCRGIWPTDEELEIYHRLSSRLDEVKASDPSHLKRIWEEIYQDILALQPAPSLYYHLIAKKDSYKKMCEEKTMEDYWLARARCQENLKAEKI